MRNSPLLTHGTRVEGRFTVYDRLGAGGIADVYFAADLESDRRGALKLIPLDSAADVLAAERAGAELQHRIHSAVPAVAEVYSFAEGQEYLWIFMENVSGPSLAAELSDGRRLDEPLAVHLALQVAEVLQAFHQGRAGVAPFTHGDIKPHNLRIEGRSRIRLLDFGLAQELRNSDSPARTEFHSIPYASPERLETGELTPAADLWALGVTLYEMLAGRLPFPGRDESEIRNLILSGRPAAPLPSTVRDPVAKIVYRCLVVEPQHRYTDASEFAAALRGSAEDPWAGVGNTLRSEGRSESVGRKPVSPSPTASAAAMHGFPDTPANRPPRIQRAPVESGRKSRNRPSHRRAFWPLVVLLAALGAWQLLWIPHGVAEVTQRLDNPGGDLDQAVLDYMALARFDLLGLTRSSREAIEQRLSAAINGVLDAQGRGEDVGREQLEAAARHAVLALKLGGASYEEEARHWYLQGQLQRADALDQAARVSEQAGRNAAAAAIRHLDHASRLSGSWAAPRFALLEIRLDPRLRPADRGLNLEAVEGLLHKTEAEQEAPSEAQRRLWIDGYSELALAAEEQADAAPSAERSEALQRAREWWSRGAAHCRLLPAGDPCLQECERALERVRHSLRQEGVLVGRAVVSRAAGR